MNFRITPSTGPQIDEVFPDGPYWDNQLAVGYPEAGDIEPSYKLGSVVRGDDGGEYFFVQASDDIASTEDTGTQVSLTFPDFSVETGSGGFYTPPGVAITSGSYLHVRRGAWNATPA